MQPVVLVTEVDLLGTPWAVIGLADAVAEIRRILRDVEIRAISATSGAGVDQLRAHRSRRRRPRRDDDGDEGW